MIMKVFGVYDSKALAFLQPFFSNSNGAAVRAFADAVCDGKSPIAMHPGDYQLYELGEFDDHSGELSPLSPTKLLCNGLDFVSTSTPISAVSPGIRLAEKVEAPSNGS